MFGALNSHAGDALFEVCYLPEFPRVARDLRDRFEGSTEVFHRQLAAAGHFDYGRFGAVLETWGYACCYSPDPARPGAALLPFETATGKLVDEVWALWLRHDPVRMVADHIPELKAMRAIFLEAGRSDEYFLDLARRGGLGGADPPRDRPRARSLFDGRHGGIAHRYPGAIARLIEAMRPSR